MSKKMTAQPAAKCRLSGQMIADVQEPRSTETGPVRGVAHTADRADG